MRTIHLIYHSVGDLSLGDKKNIFSRSLDDFKKDCQLISHFSKIHSSKVTLTFDDGYLSSLNASLYAAEFFDLSSTIFLITNKINKNGFIKKKNIEDLSNNNKIKYGFHGVTHTPFTYLSNQKLNDEIKNGKKILEDICGTQIKDVSYPHGLRSKLTDLALVRNGFRNLYTSDYGIKVAHKKLNSNEDYLIINRNCVLKNFSNRSLNFLLYYPNFNRFYLKQKIKKLIFRKKV